MGLVLKLTDRLSGYFALGRALGRAEYRSVDLNLSINLYEPEGGGGRGVIFNDASTTENIPWADWAEVTNGAVTSVRIVGADRYHSKELQMDEFGVGRELVLVPEPDNVFDPNALAVYDQSGRYMVGYIPRETAPDLAKGVAVGARVFSAWETLDDAGRRVGLRALIVAPGADVFSNAMEQVRRAASI